MKTEYTLIATSSQALVKALGEASGDDPDETEVRPQNNRDQRGVIPP
jgi:hypothetical protein